MAATIAQTAELRRMVAETSSSVYDDALLATYIERYPVPDSSGREFDHVDWIATYDLAAAAATIWEEKAAAAASKFDSTTDGATLARSQLQAHAAKMSRRYAARSYVQHVPLKVAPRPEYADETEDL